jgi:outer membrane protein TolC
MNERSPRTLPPRLARPWRLLTAAPLAAAFWAAAAPCPAAAAQARQSPPPAAPAMPASPAMPGMPSGVTAATAAGTGGILTLRRAAELALGHSHDVAAAAAALETDLAAARVAGDAFRPEAGVSTTPGVGRGLPVAVAGQVPAIVTVGVRQSLFNREDRSKGLAARAATAATRAAYQRARLQAARTAADLYSRCWTDQRQLALAEQRLEAYAAMARRAGELRDQGRATELDLAQARLRQARARLRRMEIAATRDADLWELRQRLGLPDAAAVALPEDPLAGVPDPRRGSPTLDLAAARAADPDLTAAGRQVDLLQRARDERRGILAPVTVEADAQYSRLSRANGIDQFYVKFRDDDWSIALAVAVPLWTGGRLRDGQARAEANLERVKEQRSARAAELEIEVHRAEAALQQAEAARGVGRQASAVAEEDLRIAEALAAEGRALPDDLDSRAAAVADAGDEEIKATAAILTARVQLLAVRGDLLDLLGIDDSAGEPAPAVQPPPTPSNAPVATPPPAAATAPPAGSLPAAAAVQERAYLPP